MFFLSESRRSTISFSYLSRVACRRCKKEVAGRAQGVLADWQGCMIRAAAILYSRVPTRVCAGDIVLHQITVLKIKREIKYPIYDQKPIESTADMVAAQCQFHMAVRDICRGEEGGGRIRQGFDRHTCRSGYRSRKTGCCGHNVKISGRELAAFRPRGWREPGFRRA